MAIAAILTAEKVEEMLGRKTFSEKMEDVGGVCAVQSAVSNSMGVGECRIQAGCRRRWVWAVEKGWWVLDGTRDGPKTRQTSWHSRSL